MTEKILVLFIDDEPDFLDLGRQYLERHGEFLVTMVQDVDDAFILLRDRTFDAIVSDYHMPKMNGIGLLSRLKEQGDTTPFIIYTGKGREEVVIEALNRGADFYIQKTGDPTSEFLELASKIRHAVSKRRSEKELEKVYTNLKLSQHVAHIGSWSLNLDTRVFSASEEALSIMGFPKGCNPTFEQVASAIYPDDRMLAKKSLHYLLETGEPYNIDIRIIRQDTREVRYIQSQGELIQHEHKGRKSVFGTNLDITERKKTEERLRETHSQLENLLSIANVPIIIWDPHYHIIRLNRSCERLIGRTAEEVLGKSLDILFPKEKAARSMRLIKTTTSGVRWDTVELDIVHRDGTIRTVLWNSATQYDPDGKIPVATIAQGQDVTDQRRVERERDAAELQIQQNLAQLAILNDGIRNPLTVISGYAEIFAESSLTKKILSQIQDINNMVTEIDRRWYESDKILHFLWKHGEINQDSLEDTFSVPQSGDNCLPDRECQNEPSDTVSDLLVEEVQAELFTILDSIDAIVYVADIQTYEILYLNLLGRSHIDGDSIGKKCYQILLKDCDKPCTYCQNHLPFDRSGSDGVHTWDLYDRDNNRWFDCRDRIIRWSDGRPVRLEIAIDISEHKRMEESLRESEERFRAISEYSHDANCIVDESGKIVWVNSKMEEISGYSREQIRNKESFIQFLAPESIEFVVSNFHKVIAGEPYEHHYFFSIIRADGEKRLCEKHMMDFVDIHGKRNLIISMLDITERKQAEDDLRESEEKYRILLDESSDPVFSLTSEGRYRYANQALAEVFGKPVEEIIGGKIGDFFPKEEAEKQLAALNEVFRTGERNVIEGPVQRPDGDRYYVTTISPVKDASGVVISAICSSKNITERKQAEDALRESETRWQYALEGAGDGVWDWNLLTNRVFFSRQWKAMLGYEENEIGNTLDEWDSRIHPDDKARCYSDLDRYFNGVTPVYQNEHRVLCKDGTYTWVLDRGKIIEWTKDGKPLRIIGTHSDIEQRKRAQIALQEKSKELEDFFDIALDLLCIADTNGNFIRVNKAWENILGYTTDELEHRKFLDFVHPDDMQATLNTISQLAHNEQVLNFINRYRSKDGTWRYIEWRSHPTGTLIYAAARDITERKKTEQALKENEEKFISIFSESPDPILILNPKHMIIEVNREFEKVFGYSKDVIIGKNLADLGIAYRDENIETILARTDPQDDVLREELNLVSQTGIPFIADMAISPILIHGEHCLLIHIHDIDQIRRAHEAVAQANRKLNILSSITRHDILNKVMAISFYCKEIWDDLRDPNLKKDLDIVIRSGDDIQNLIEFTRYYQDLGTREPEWQHVEQILNRRSIHGLLKGIQFTSDLGSLFIYADLMLEKVLFNLFENSVRHGQHLTTIRLSCQETELDIIIRYKDDGGGIERDEKEKIFKKGFGKNTGMGLFLIREILSITGISITETGEPGVGACFEILVPAGKWRYSEV